MILEQHPGDLRETRVGSLRILSDIAQPVVVERNGRATLEFASPATGTGTVFIESPLGDAVGFWHPDARWERTLPPDWQGRTATSLVSSAPIGCLYDHAGLAIFAYAFDELVAQTTIRFGVSEERATFVVAIDLAIERGRATTLALSGASGTLGEAVTNLREWLETGLGIRPMTVPSTAREPVYSTWYSFHGAMTSDALEAEVAEAGALGLGSVFIDFGWQRGGDGRYFDGCGDWVPDPTKFPDFAGTVSRIKQRGLSVVAWIAPLLVGDRSDAAQLLAPWATAMNENLRTHILDPRIPGARAHVVRECVRVVREYGLDGLKIDFLETAMAYAGVAGTGDIADVGVAMQHLLSHLREALGDSVLVEFRQPYVSPAIAAYGNILRAFDCPGDSVANRTSIVDARLSSAGQVVHSDMMMWHPELGDQALARHLHSALFSVPQLSVMLRTVSDTHRAVIRSWLALWRELSPTLLDGTLSAVGAHINFPVVRADSTDGANTVIAVYEPDQVVVLARAAETTVIVNATPAGELHLDLDGASDSFSATSRDLHGTVTVARELASGSRLVALAVQPSGSVLLSRTRAHR